MLILTRNLGQGLQIGDEIIIALMKQQGERIEIGISAPRKLAISKLTFDEMWGQGRLQQLDNKLRKGMH
ncbi:MAG: carbon storage regulator [Legionellales bacterium]|nr:carbon storage regulator [Legionellales bacterium]|tara:strand:- start:2254 stop:2460 length:207 start_codon:yes stop_codon:yes gene_type:complete